MKKLICLLFVTFLFPLYSFSLPQVDSSGTYQVTASVATEQYAIIGSFDGQIRLVDIKTYDILLLDEAHKKPVISMSVSDNGKLLASASQDDSIIIWDITTLKPIKKIVKQGMGVRAVALSKNGDKLYIAYPAIIYEYETTNWTATNIYDMYKNSIYSIAINSRGNILAVGSKTGDIYITDLKKGEITQTYKAGNDMILSLDFATNKNILASGGIQGIKLYNIDETRQIKNVLSFSNVRSVALNYDGTKIVAGSSDKGIVMYDILAGNFIYSNTNNNINITVATAPKSFKFIVYGVGSMYEKERYATITYPSNKTLYKKLYSFKDSDIIISESGYIYATGNFEQYILSYYKGNKESLEDIINRYFRKDKLYMKNIR